MVSLYEEELKAMPRADVLNAHKRGNRMLIGKPKMEKGKLYKIAEQIDGKNAQPIAELAGKMKVEGFGIVNHDAGAIADKYGVDEKFIGDAVTTLKESDKNRTIVDFDDMLRFPVLDQIKRPVNGFILIDEAQDYNPNMCEFLKLFIGDKTKGLVTGDAERQALQQFAGGDPATFYKLAEVLNCETIPLTYNFRCVKSIVANANEFYPSDMEPAPGNCEGEVGETSINDLEGLDDNSAILSEMNSPLLSFVITQIEQNKSVQFRPGKLWEKCQSAMWGLMDTRKYPIGTIADRAEEKAIEYAGDKGVDSDKLESIKCVRLLENLCLSLNMTKVKWNYKTPVHPIQQILEMLAKNNSGPFAMTGHTAKGLQWDNVYHINKVPAPRPNVTPKPWEIHQWRCVGYVIRTRAIQRHMTLT
jgi:hypothetical protein